MSPPLNCAAGEGRIAAICAVGLFLLLTSVALAGADTPPPSAFLWLVAAFATLSGVAYRRVKTYLRARPLPGGRQARAAAFEGCAVGLTLGLMWMLGSGGEPGVTPSISDRVIFLAVMGGLGASTAAVLWWIAAWMHRRLSHQASARRRR
ncbi:hypothetical protein I1E95_11850 [Synechococcus sp. CBW1107]|uniref:hypothetical protein n=1 Tax=Synechococcus sp. CBW1107 TaxID=2789857 RepID=UPI0018CDB14E|nr:hypothetical protein [Synechococcus sp. CBW1107]QPN55842.1 hypothetical protein I1E95_11850 [Synechococcus sp. CBW1107]